MNGVKLKFVNDEVLRILDDADILIVQETHFNIRVRCPTGFLFIARSAPIESKVPRGGVAIYKNERKEFDIDVVI